jgi:hypothetical protein
MCGSSPTTNSGAVSSPITGGGVTLARTTPRHVPIHCRGVLNERPDKLNREEQNDRWTV